MRRAAVLLVLTVMVAAAACHDGPEPRAKPRPLTTVSAIGDGEGELNLLAFAGYAEDGSSDVDYDWVHPFERETGCSVHVRYVDSGAEIVRQLSRGGDQVYDGASVSGDVAGLLTRSGGIAALDPALFRHADEYLAPFREGDGPTAVTGGHVFGTPALYGPDLLLYATDRVRPAPTSSSVLFDAASPYAGRIAMLDSPMAIADAALYLAAHRPELGIADPYELTPAQLDAAATLLEEQAPRVGLYWTAFTDLVDAFASNDVVVGQGSPLSLSLLTIDGGSFAATIPSEGATGWADTWMMTADAPHPNCMIRWMRWTSTPEIQAEMAIWYGGSPSNAKACAIIRQRLGEFADAADALERCGDEAFLGALALWTVPTVACGDERGRSCAGYPAWLDRWQAVRDAA